MFSEFNFFFHIIFHHKFYFKQNEREIMKAELLLASRNQLKLEYIIDSNDLLNTITRFPRIQNTCWIFLEINATVARTIKYWNSDIRSVYAHKKSSKKL